MKELMRGPNKTGLEKSENIPFLTNLNPPTFQIIGLGLRLSSFL